MGLSKEEVEDYGLHSLHISYATNLSQGVEELNLQRAGRWKSAACAQDYVQMNEARKTKPGVLLLGQLLAL